MRIDVASSSPACAGRRHLKMLTPCGPEWTTISAPGRGAVKVVGGGTLNRLGDGG